MYANHKNIIFIIILFYIIVIFLVIIRNSES